MTLRKQSGNMYEFVTHTWNVVKGECEHDCFYCYMKRFGELKPVRFDEKELKRDLGSGNFIFVGSSNDMFSDCIPAEWIIKTLNTCSTFQNEYLFQSKNPARFYNFAAHLPGKTVLGTTIETNRNYAISKAPSILERVEAMAGLRIYPFDRMVTIEPIFDFDIDELTDLVYKIDPYWVNIGADSKKNDIPEPSFDKVTKLIEKLSLITTVKQKRNLKRLQC